MQFTINIIFLIYIGIEKKVNKVRLNNLLLMNLIVGLFVINIFPIVIGGIADYPFINTLFDLSLLFKTVNIVVLITEIFLFIGITIFLIRKSYSVKLIMIINILISFIVELLRFLSRYNPANLIYIVLAVLTSAITIIVYKSLKNRKEQ